MSKRNLLLKFMDFDFRISAINCLLSSLYIDDSADFSDVVLRDQISNEAYVMTPKVLSVFKCIALGDEKLGHSLISVSYPDGISHNTLWFTKMHYFQLAVKGIGRFLCLVFEDYNKTSKTHDVSIEDFKALMKRGPNEKISNVTDSNILSEY